MNFLPTRSFLGAILLSLCLPTTTAVAEEPAADFRQALEQSGWRVQQRENGDLILRPEAAAEATQKTETAANDASDMSSAMTRLAEALRETGWKVEQAADGSLLLRSHEQSATRQPLGEDALQRLRQAGWGVSHDSDGSLLLTPPPAQPSGQAASPPHSQKTESSEKNTSDEMARLAEALRKTGWKVERTADGGLLLRSHEEPASGRPLEEGALQRLRQAGWGISHDAEGSLLLTPPSSQPATNATSAARSWAGQSPSPGKTALLRPCPGVRTTASVDLPLKSAKEARTVAIAWLKAGNLDGAVVGRIRKVFHVYLVSIVARQRPHRLLHQIAIRDSDGRVILLD